MTIKIKLINEGTKNKNKVIIENTENGKFLKLCFSYETLISVNNKVVNKVYSNTTSKYQNELNPNKETRISEEELNALFEMAIRHLFVKSESA